MFIDQAKIFVKAGKGGDGMVAFRREKFVPNGGPAGGDGGQGGSIILRADKGLRTLTDYRYHRHFKATAGGQGMIKGMYGRKAENLFLKVPLGTVISDFETNEFLGDLVKDGQELVVAKGGRGGRGNIHFASSKNPAPEIAENGEPGVQRVLQLELKVLADVGLIGFPSVGKSTLLAAITSAKPKIAAYQFTTLTPNLGMVQLPDGRDFAVADLPGLIEGASQGVGLGISFLRHIERTKVLLHVIDMSGSTGRDPIVDYQKINHELAVYDPALLKRPQIIVASKMDLPQAAENLKKFKEKLQQPNSVKIIGISAVTHQGLAKLLEVTAELVEKTPAFLRTTKLKTTNQLNVKYQAQQPAFTVTRDANAVWILSGEKLERLFEMTNFEHDESTMRFARQLKSLGVDDELRKRGAKNGDLVKIKDFTFEFVD